MPLGDSITSGSDGHATYRYWLWKQLQDAGCDVDFVGSQFGVYAGTPPANDFDQDHEGHWGWRADQILAFVHDWVLAAQPDIVLIHLGHNDLWQEQGVPSTIEDLRQIILEIRAVNPETTFLLAQIIPAYQRPALFEIPLLNTEIPYLAAELDDAESPVLVVDQYADFDAAHDTWDGVHPNDTGEQKMSARWFGVLGQLLRSTTDVPVVGLPLARLLPSYPNPFNPRTSIRYELPAGGWVRLEVLDVRGQLVSTLAEGEQDEGLHTLSWEAPSRLCSGPYLLRLETGGRIQSQKLLLVK